MKEKTLDNINSFPNQSFKEYFGKIVLIDLPGNRSIAGKVVDDTGPYLTIEHKDNRRTRIKKEHIQLIGEMPPTSGGIR